VGAGSPARGADSSGPAQARVTARPPLSTRSAATAAGRAAQDLAGALLDRCDFPSAPAVLAVSGGADSLALLVLAARAGLEVLAVHVDHGLRPGSNREAGVVAAAAAAYGAAFEARSVTVPPGPDLEARARQARYGVLPAGVLTGHTMDDQAETVLLAMLRGAGLDGLAGMRSPGGPAAAERPDRTDPIDAAAGPVRPLLGLRRSETAALCAAEGLTPVEDPSNRDLRFRRNRVRHQVLPLLCEVAGRDLVPVLARQARLLGDDAGVLEALAAEIDATDTRQLAAAPRPLARRAVRRWLRSAGTFPDAELHPPTADEVARVLAVADGVVRACELTGGRRVERHAGRLRVIGR
jgi:tRNA(Ile)-lysidine synthase